jgi:hypothetical protein
MPKVYGTWTLYGICFYIVCFVFLTLVAMCGTFFILLLSPLLLFFCYRSFMGYGTVAKFDRVICNQYETNMIATRIKDEFLIVYNDWVGIKYDQDVFNIHSLVIVSSVNTNPKPTLLWLHGVGGTGAMSIVLSGIADKLAHHFDIYAVDLPGFGRSTAPAHYKHSRSVFIHSHIHHCAHYTTRIYLMFCW